MILVVTDPAAPALFTRGKGFAVVSLPLNRTIGPQPSFMLIASNCQVGRPTCPKHCAAL